MLIRITAIAAVGAMTTLLAGCSKPAPSKGDDLLEWVKNNPPATEATWSAASEWVCKPTVMDVCGAESCKQEKTTTYVVYRPAKKEYQRCDDKGCDTYTPTVAYSGAFTNLALPNNAVLFKASSDKHYLEVATSMNVALIYRGKCEPRG